MPPPPPSSPRYDIEYKYSWSYITETKWNVYLKVYIYNDDSVDFLTI